MRCLNLSSSVWSSSRFSRRSTDQTCQSGAFSTTHLASGTKYAPPADVPGSSTSTFFAPADPTLITPTLSYLAGVPGAAKPGIQVTPSGVATEVSDGDELAVLDDEGDEVFDEELQLEVNAA